MRMHDWLAGNHLKKRKYFKICRITKTWFWKQNKRIGFPIKIKKNTLLESVENFGYIHWARLPHRNWGEKSHVCETSRNAAIIWFYFFLIKSIDFSMEGRHATNKVSTKLRSFSCKSNCTQFLNLWLNCWWSDKYKQFERNLRAVHGARVAFYTSKLTQSMICYECLGWLVEIWF